MGKWDRIDNPQAVIMPAPLAPPASNGGGGGDDKDPRFLPALHELARHPVSLEQWRARREALKVIRQAQMDRLRAVVEARLKYDRARIEVELTKALARNRDELFSFMETLGVQQFERRHQIAMKLEEVAKTWWGGLLERDMPEFMRQRQIQAVTALWEREFDRLMKDETGE